MADQQLQAATEDLLMPLLSAWASKFVLKRKKGKSQTLALALRSRNTRVRPATTCDCRRPAPVLPLSLSNRYIVTGSEDISCNNASEWCQNLPVIMGVRLCVLVASLEAEGRGVAGHVDLRVWILWIADVAQVCSRQWQDCNFSE